MRIRTLLLPSALIYLLSCTAANAQQGTAGSGPAAPPSAPLCSAMQLKLSTDAKDGDFNGMSHSGTLVVLRNTGRACSLQPFPEVTLYGGNHPLNVTFAPPGAQFMHPGPVVLPVAIAAGGQVSSGLRWVSGQVFDQSVCLQSTSLHVKIEGIDLTTPLHGTLCGDSVKGVQAELARWAPVSTSSSTK
jgi:hypothetical protein